MYFFFTTPNQLAGHERISPQKDAKNFSLSFLYIFRLELYGSTPYLIKNETVVQVSVKLGIILTCKPKCKGLFRSRRACKHHRTTQCKLANVKPRFFHFIYHAFISIVHSCELALDNQLRPLTDSTSQYENMLREAESTCSISFFFFIFPLHVLTFHFFFVTGNFQT